MVTIAAVNLVLLHPLPLDGSVWPAELNELADRVLAPTLYQYGDHLQDWAHGVLDETARGPLVVVGNSVGASCAIEIARMVPDRVRLLVLVGAKAGHRPEPQLRDEAVEVLRHEGMAGAWPRYWAPLFAPDANRAVVQRARLVAEAQETADVIRGIRAFHGRADRDGFLASYSGRIVVVSGVHDRPTRARKMAAGLRDGSFVTVPGAGHYVPLEQPGALTGVVRGAVNKLVSTDE